MEWIDHFTLDSSLIPLFLSCFYVSDVLLIILHTLRPLRHDGRYYYYMYKKARKHYCLSPCSIDIPKAVRAFLPRSTQCCIVRGSSNHDGVSETFCWFGFSFVGA